MKVLGQVAFCFYLAVPFPKIDNYHARDQLALDVGAGLWDADAVCVGHFIWTI